MVDHLIRVAALPVLAWGVFLTGCQNAALPTAARPAPVLNLATGAPITLVRQGTSTMSSGMTSRPIGRAGGTLRVGPHQLIIPAGAVDTTTTFTMRVLQEGLIDVRLEATRWVDGRWVAVGTEASPFRKRLQLRLSYRGAAQVGAEENLLITYLVDGTPAGPLRGIDSWIDLENRTVISYVDHFSRYGIGESRSTRVPGGRSEQAIGFLQFPARVPIL